MLDVRGLAVRFGNVAALDGVDLTVHDGEIVCVLGPSGSGKSTLLRAIAGLDPPAAGTVAWDGADLAGVAPHRRQLGLMFQDHALFPHRDVLGNVAFGLRMQRLPRATVETRAREALALVALTGYERRRVRELSGGEQQRVALARALAPAPRLLMLDEPLGSLDRRLRERLMLELRVLFVELGLTALFVTHDHDEAFALADRVVIMHAGRVEQEGQPEEVWRHPSTEFAARFLGFVNTIDVDVPVAVFGAPAARSPWGPVPVPAGTRAGRARLALRPEGLRLTDDGPIEGVVEARTFRRDHFLLRVKVTGGPPFDVAVPPHPLPAVGQTVRLTPDPDAMVVLPLPHPPSPSPFGVAKPHI
jgi:thiamine transport system ATP-binding protein